MKLSRRLATINGPEGAKDGWTVLYEARAMAARGIPVTMLCIGDHDMPTDPAILDAMDRAARAGDTRYAPVEGSRALRDLIAARAMRETGIATGPENVFVANGGQGALFTAMMATADPGDTVVIVDPFYTTYPPTVRAAGGRLKVLEAGAASGFRPEPAAVMAATRGARALLVNSPNNPTGAVFDMATLEGIRAAALENDLWVLSDEVYSGHVHDGVHVSIRSLPGMAERTITIGSLSKSHVMTGFRLGWCVGPEPVIAAMTGLGNATTYGNPGFVQAAAIAALRDGERIERETAAIYRRRRDVALEALKGENAIRVSPPDGGMYVLLDIRATGMSGEDFALDLLRSHHIALMPGESYGRAAAGHVRVALTRDETVLREALATIAGFARARAR